MEEFGSDRGRLSFEAFREDLLIIPQQALQITRGQIFDGGKHLCNHLFNGFHIGLLVKPLFKPLDDQGSIVFSFKFPFEIYEDLVDAALFVTGLEFPL